MKNAIGLRAHERRLGITVSFSVFAVFCGAASLPALAQQAARVEVLEEIVVSAERRTENLQKTAVAVSVRTGDELRDEGKFTVNQILEDVPSVSLQVPYGTNANTDVHVPNVSIRGVSSNGPVIGSTSSLVPAVAVYVDGVVNGLGATYDLNRVEVLRGPQGTLYGRSATGGLLNVHTNQPALNEFGGDASVEFGDYSLQHYSAALNVPAGEVLALRVAGNYYKRDGHYSPKGGAVDTLDGRVKLLYKPSDQFSALIGVAMQDNDEFSGQNQGSLTRDDEINFDTIVPLGKGKDKTRQYWAEINWNLGPATLTYLPALQTWEQDAITYGSPGGGLLVTGNQATPRSRFNTQELRLASNAEARFKWQTGVFYYDNDLRNTYYLLGTGGTLPPGGIVLQDSVTHRRTENVGVFAESTFDLTAATRLTAGLRYDDTKVRTDVSSCAGLVIFPLNCLALTPQEGTRSWKNWTYKLRFEQDLTSSNLWYASVATAFLPGDVAVTNGLPDARLVKAPYEAETLTSFEVGSKNRFLDDRLQANAAVFYYRYGGFQQPVKVGAIGPVSLFTIATSPANMFGAEFELLFQATHSNRFGLDASYVNPRYRDKPALFQVGVVQDRIPGIVPVSISPSYTHTFDLPSGQTLSLGLEALYRSAFDVNAATQVDESAGLRRYFRVDDQLTGNVNATWKLADNISLSAYVRNVSDERYKTFLNVSSTATIVGAVVVSEPRTFGAVLNIGF